MEWPAPPPREIVLPEAQTEERKMKIAVLGIDLGKNVCSVVGLDPSGAVVLRRRVRGDTLIDLVAKLPSCIVGMEACCGAHHLRRLFAAQGHDVRLMSPEYVRPYVKAQKRRFVGAHCRCSKAVRDDCVNLQSWNGWHCR